MRNQAVSTLDMRSRFDSGIGMELLALEKSR